MLGQHQGTRSCELVLVADVFKGCVDLIVAYALASQLLTKNRPCGASRATTRGHEQLGVVAVIDEPQLGETIKHFISNRFRNLTLDEIVMQILARTRS